MSIITRVQDNISNGKTASEAVAELEALSRWANTTPAAGGTAAKGKEAEEGHQRLRESSTRAEQWLLHLKYYLCSNLSQLIIPLILFFISFH